MAFRKRARGCWHSSPPARSGIESWMESKSSDPASFDAFDISNGIDEDVPRGFADKNSMLKLRPAGLQTMPQPEQIDLRILCVLSTTAVKFRTS